MAAGWSVMDALNKNSKAAVGDKPKARFRTKDISIRKMYSNDQNFYSMQRIEELAQEILSVGMLENMTVAYAPCEKGEYRIIAGERRWRALMLLLEKGYSEFEIATCQIKAPAERHEELVQLIMANSYRDKTVMEILEEERLLKESLQYMKKNGLTLQGYKLDSGRLRDVIASIMNMTSTKIGQIESINKHLIPEFSEEIKEGRLTFSAAYEISGLPEKKQGELLERHRESGLTWKEVKEVKKGGEETKEVDGALFPEKREEIQAEKLDLDHEEEVKAEREAGRQTQKETPGRHFDEESEEDGNGVGGKSSILQGEREERKTNTEKIKKVFYVSEKMFKNITSYIAPYMIVKQEKERYKENDILTILEVKDGKETGKKMTACVTCADDSSTSAAIKDGYCVIGVMEIYDAEGAGIIDLGDEE